MEIYIWGKFVFFHFNWLKVISYFLFHCFHMHFNQRKLFTMFIIYFFEKLPLLHLLFRRKYAQFTQFWNLIKTL